MSPERQSKRRWFSKSGLILLLVVVAIAVLIPLVLPEINRLYWPRGARTHVLERVERAGGWRVIRQECASLVTNYPPERRYRLRAKGEKMLVMNFEDGRIRDTRHTDNPFPLSGNLAELQPREIEFDATTNGPTVVRLKFFGSGKTDWSPYYGLWVVCNSESQDFVPVVTDTSGHTINKVTNFIFEVYQRY